MTKYFGKARAVLDETRSADTVVRHLETAIARLRAGEVAVDQLVERNRVSKPLEGYTQNTRTVAALKRARKQELAVHPGQDIEYVVVDDQKSSRDRVALAHEDITEYDSEYYETQLVRVVESVLSPMGWDREDIRREQLAHDTSKLYRENQYLGRDNLTT